MFESIFGKKKKDDKELSNKNNNEVNTKPIVTKNNVVKKEDVKVEKVIDKENIVNETMEVHKEVEQVVHVSSVTVNESMKEKNTIMNDIIDDVAVMFSSNQDREASEILVKHLNDNKGNVDKKIWYLLLDLYQSTEQKVQFEKIAMYFAKQFDCSPPSWLEISDVVVKNNSIGANLLTLDTIISEKQKPRFDLFLKSVRTAKTGRLDLSRLKPDLCSKSSFSLLTNILEQMRKYKVNATLLGDINLFQFLETTVEESKSTADKEDMDCWLLYLELLQWKNQEDKFEEYAFEYACVYEMSPPSFDKNAINYLNLNEAINEEALSLELEEDNNIIIPEKILNEGNILKLNAQIENCLKNNNEVVIDFYNVKRIDFNSAGIFTSFLYNFNGKDIKIEQPNELIKSLLEMLNINQFCRIVERKR